MHSVSGVYVGDYFGGEETYRLRTDGTFTQQFVRGGKTQYINSGHWSIDSFGSDSNITFEHVIFPYNEDNIFGPTLRPTDGGAYGRDDGYIYINPDLGVVIRPH